MRLPIAVPPAKHETLASYLTRLANLHGIDPRELWELGRCPSCAARHWTG
jgi:hypothetical protein